MLENYSGFTFTELDFTMALIHELRKYGIRSFNKAKIEEELYAYRDKYLALFLDIDCRDDRLHLDESIGILTITGEIYDLAPNFDKKYTRGMWELKEASAYQPYYEEMAELVKEYITRKKIEDAFLQENHIKLRIHSLNPNRKYSICRGLLAPQKIVARNLVTTGEISLSENEKLEYSTASIEIPCIGNREWAYLKQYQSADIDVQKSRFVVIQGMINDNILTMDLYSESCDKSELYTYAGAGRTTESNKDIQVLSLRKK